MAFSTSVTIGGTSVNDYLVRYKVIDSVDDANSANLILSEGVLSSLDLDSQQEVVITRTNDGTVYTIFKGYVSQITKAGGANINVEAFDKLWLLARQSLTKTYDINIDTEAGVISAIAEDIIQTYGGLTADVEATGAVNVIDKFYALNNSLMDLLNQLAELVDYRVYYDPAADTVNFKPSGFESFGTILQVGTNIANVPLWDYDYTLIANVISLTGDYQELETTEAFDGDGADDDFVLGSTPESVKVTVGGTLQTGGVPGQSDLPFDYSVDKENKTINFEAASIPGVGVGNVSIAYSYLEPIVVTQKNPVSRAAYGDYAYNKYIDTIKTTDDAELKIQEITDKFSEPIVKTTLQVVNVFGLKAGLKVSVIDTINDENREVNIKRVIYNYPEVIDELSVDDEPVYSDYVSSNMITERIDRLERRNQTQGNLINQLFSLDRTFSPRRRYIKLQKEVITDTDILLWDHPSNQGKWNDGGSIATEWGGNAFGSTTVLKIVQGNMTYNEYCYDTDFHDAVNSTATFDTGNLRIDFTAGQVWYSSDFDIGTTLTFVTITLGTLTGSVTIELSSDGGSTWQTITAGSRTAVTTSDGTGTRMRITEDATATARIESTLDTYGQRTVTDSAIKVLMEE